MQCKNRVRKKNILLLAAFLFVAALTACGKTDAPEGAGEGSPIPSPVVDVGEGYAADEGAAMETGEGTAEDAAEQGTPDGQPTDATGQETSGGQPMDATGQEPIGERTVDPLPEMTKEEQTALQYVEKVILEDYLDGGTEYEAYAPKDAQRSEDYIYYSGHGLHFDVIAADFGSDDLLDGIIDDLVQSDYDSLVEEDYYYWEMEAGEMIRCGDGRFRIATVKTKDFEGNPYNIKKIYFMNVLQEGIGILWSLQMTELNADDVTNAIIDEIGRCYRIDLEEIKVGDAWFEAEAGREEQRQDVYEPWEGEIVLEKVEGYQYMGLAAISDLGGDVRCPIMVPMGSRTRVRENSAEAHMHGVEVSGNLYHTNDYLDSVQFDIDSAARVYERNPDTYANARVGAAQPIPGYSMARCAVITYEKKSSFTGEFLPRVDVLCCIKVHEEYYLKFTVTLSYDEYDGSTNTLLKELEIAYGIDLSEYHNEED